MPNAGGVTENSLGWNEAEPQGTDAKAPASANGAQERTFPYFAETVHVMQMQNAFFR